MARKNLLAKLQADFPTFTFQNANDFYYSPQEKTIFYADLSQENARPTLLHELAHAILDHRFYNRDIKLIAMERDAWEYALHTLGPNYHIDIPSDYVEQTMNTYRDWLHARSTCPKCSSTGVQTDQARYLCLGCGNSWRVNDARRCGLKRYSS